MSYFSSRSNVISGNEDLSLLSSSRQVPSKEESDSDHLVDLKHSLKDLSAIALYERIEQQHLTHSDLFKLYCQSIAPNSIPSSSVSSGAGNLTTTPPLVHSRSENSLLSNTSNNVYKSLLELINSNDMLFSIVIWIATQIPLSQRFSKSLKKNFDRVFTSKTFVSLLTSQLHKQQMLYFPSLNYAGIKSHMDIVEKINSLYKTTFNQSSSQNQASNQLLSYSDESFSFKQAWSKVQAETFGQFLLEIGIIQNIKPEKKRKFTERSHYYMFNIETILYYAELFFEDKISSQQQQNVLNQFRNPTHNDSGFTAFSQNVFSPFLSNISAASMHLVSIGQNLQKSSVLSLIVSQEREFEMIQSHIKKTHEEIAQESTSSSSLDVTSPRSGESPSQLTDATSSAFSLVFRQDHQRSKSRDFARTAPKVNHHRMSTNLSLNHEQFWNQPKDLELKEVIRGKNQHLFETPALSPRSRFYEENGIKAKIHSIQQALNSPTVNEEFKSYCIKDHSEENILFWKEIQAYRRLQSPNERKLKFKRLVSEYISTNSTTPVNLESKIITSFLTLAEENEENSSFFSPEVFNELEWLVVNNMKDTFTRFNEERNAEIDCQIDELQQKLRLEAIKKEQHSKSFLSQVASAIGRKKTNSTSTSNNSFSNNDLIIPPPKVQIEESKKEMERVPAHEYCTLEAVLCSANARKQFRIFCKKEHAEEYILFLDSVDEYKTLTGKLDRCKKAHDIFNTFMELPTSGSFLHEEDVRTLDCTKDERETIRKKLDSGEVGLFDAVVISIQNQMLDVYNRFATAQKEWKAKKMLM